jgi:ATP-dependent Zn protease
LVKELEANKLIKSRSRFNVRLINKKEIKIMEQLTQFAPFFLMFVVIYFFMIRPQQKKAKNEKEFERLSRR